MWTEGGRVRAEDAAGGNQFGRAVAVRGPRAIVGAPGHGDNRGAVYIFRYDGARWNQEVRRRAACEIGVLGAVGLPPSSERQSCERVASTDA